MRDKKKRVVNLVFLAAVFLLTLAGVLKGENISDLKAHMMETDGHWLLGRYFCVAVFIILGALIIRIMMGRIRQQLGLGKCLLLSGVGYFFREYYPPLPAEVRPCRFNYMKKRKDSHSGLFPGDAADHPDV